MNLTLKKNRSLVQNQKKSFFSDNIEFYIMLIPAMIFYIVFKYVPIYGVLMAFKDYNFMLGVFKSPWVGLDVFKEMFKNASFWNALLNTIRLNFLLLVFNFPVPIIFALFLNEIGNNKFKRLVQSISYLPHFISWVIIYGLILSFTARDTGLINILLKGMGVQQIDFLSTKGWWTFIFVFSNIWKETGWAAIIYLSALSSIDPGLYEAAAIDGADKLRCMWHITLPGIKSTIIIILILNIGKIMSMGFEQPYLLGNPLVSDISSVISTYVYDTGLIKAQYSYTTAVGLFQSVVNFIFLIGADYIAKLFGEEGLFGGGKK